MGKQVLYTHISVYIYIYININTTTNNNKDYIKIIQKTKVWESTGCIMEPRVSCTVWYRNVEEKSYTIYDRKSGDHNTAKYVKPV